MEDHLVQQYGVLMTLDQLAAVMSRSRDGLRLTLAGSSELAQRFRPARVKIGRRVHFKTSVVAAVLESI